MTASDKKIRTWQPLEEDTLNRIDDLFSEIFPVSEYGKLAEDVSEYWIERLEHAWANKPENIRKKDLAYSPDDPLSRILPTTMVIAYPDSIHHEDQPTLEILERFLDEHFPSVSGLHILPACAIVEKRFNDGYFSQVKRRQIHKRFGTNETFSRLAEKYFSMADFVLNHVDIENPNFQAFLKGEDDAGNCFYVFSESMYQHHKAAGAFDKIFRPRPFPLFTIFRREPEDEIFQQMNFEQKCDAIHEILAPHFIDNAMVKVFTVFEKIQNDQVLPDTDYANITAFIQFLQKAGIPTEAVFHLSQNQETTNPPYIFNSVIRKRSDLLSVIGYEPADANRIAHRYESFDSAVFGEQIRAMTTFSHVQIDVNTATLEGLKMLADDFSWYLGLDINMLRLDAANYAFKKFYTSSFGLPEVKKLMRILYLSMDCVSPRIVANLEINDQLSVVLSYMADKESPPPMIYDFHLPSMLPVVFNTGDARILDRIFFLIARYDIPKECIRFSLAESHDGKSVRGSLDLLTVAERWALAETVRQNGGLIKYKSVIPRRCHRDEFASMCKQTDLDYTTAAAQLFIDPQAGRTDDLVLKNSVETTDHIIEALDIKKDIPDKHNLISFFADRMINGREPYELCCSTRDSLVRIGDEKIEAKRFLGFYALAFALMGRNVKSIYFNDMVGLPNDPERMRKTGEYRDIKRTRSSYPVIVNETTIHGSIHRIIAGGINTLIKIVDNDMALHPKGNEAGTIFSGNPAVAIVHNHYQDHHSLAIVNTTNAQQEINADISIANTGNNISNWTDLIGNKSITTDYNGDIPRFSITLSPFDHLWLKPSKP